jgi:indolepyruvate ferredoxin oxidoreductase
MQRCISEATGPDNSEFLDATRLATGLLGDSIASNLFMLGYAYQRGLVPVSACAIEQAIALNSVAVEWNLDAFRWGRRAAADPALVEGRATVSHGAGRAVSETLDQMSAPDRVPDGIKRRVCRAICQLDPPFKRGRDCAPPRPDQLTQTAARALFKLMAYKDEYESPGFIPKVIS